MRWVGGVMQVSLLSDDQLAVSLPSFKSKLGMFCSLWKGRVVPGLQLVTNLIFP